MALAERYREATLASALALRATTDPESLLALQGSARLTVGQADADADSLAAALHDLGVEEGDRIAIILPACFEFVVSLFAAAKLGAVVIPLDPRLAASELQYMLRHSEAVAAITIETLDGLDYLQLFEDLLVQLPELQYLLTVGKEDLWYDDRIFQFEDLVSAGTGRDYPAGSGDRDAVFAIPYTSGTTGKPKGVELTQGNLIHVAAGTADALGLNAEDGVAGITAFFHAFGIGPGVVGSLLSGAVLVLPTPDREGEEEALLDAIESAWATVLMGVPTTFVRLLQAHGERPRGLDGLRLGLAAGAPVRDELIDEVRRTLGIPLFAGYSVTEAASIVAVSSIDDPEIPRRFTSGHPLARTEIRILEEDGSPLPVESVGEIAIRGPGVMRGYARQPKETARSFTDDGFFLTGDLGMVDEKGYLHLVGRRKDVIIRGGFNIYPREVEDRILGHPAVVEAAVVGVPDEVLGEAISACVVPVEGAIVTESEVQDWCRTSLADYKVPDRVRFFDEFPLTGTGKVRRTELARILREQG